jgi:RNA polymerase sigma-70 factor (ECF subfamily)
MTSLEALFEHYRAGGELAALAEIFDRTAPSLTALGVHLVRDPVEAEDLVQATFVAAIEGAGSFQAGRRLEPWLVGILARQAARVWRRRGRTHDPRAEAEPALDPSFAAEKRELAEALELALERLAPRERDVLRRYLDGERPLDIAASKQQSAGAVRMQVLRGLERLRKLLPSGLHAVLPLARLPRGLESVRAEVLAHAGSAAALAPAALVPVTVGALAMSTKLAAAALVVSALVYVFFHTPSEDPISKQRPELMPALVVRAPERVVPPDPSAPAAREARVDASTAAPAFESAVSAPAREGLWLVGKLLGLEGVDPTTTEILVGGAGRAVQSHGRADATYAIELNSLELGSHDHPLLQIHATHPAWRSTRREVRIDDDLRGRMARGYSELSVDLDLSPRTSVVGRVAEGEPSAALLRNGLVMASVGNEENDGTFALFPADPGAYELRVRVPGRLPLRLDVEVEKGEIRDVGTLVLADEGVAIEGYFVPHELLRSRIRLVANRTDSVEEEDSWSSSGSTEVRSDGTFCITALEPGEYELSLSQQIRGDRVQFAYPDRTMRAPSKDVEFGRELGLVRFHMRGVTVEPPAMLLFSNATNPEVETHSAQHLQIVDARPIEVLVDRRKSFSAAVRTKGARAPWRSISAGRPALHEETFELREAPPEPEAQAAPRFGALELTWQFPESQVLPSWVRAYGLGNAEAEPRADGCRFERLEPGRYRVVVVPLSARFWEPLPSFAGTRAIEVEIEADGTSRAEVEWYVGGRARFVPDGKPRGEAESMNAVVRDASGERCVATFVVRINDPDHTHNSYANLPLLRSSELEPIFAPGAYTLELSDDTRVLVAVPFTIVAGELVDVPVVLPE